VEAALEIQHVGEQRGQIANEIRPIFLTPFAHVYFFKDPEDTLRRAGDALRELESHSMIAIDSAQGDLPKRLRRAADQLLENKAKEYGIPREEWCDDDRFVRTRKLREAVLTRLEKDYLGRNETGYARRRASRVRMACYERLADSGLSEEARRRIEKDLRKTRELILMTPFRRDYSEKHNDLEMWVEYLCRFRQALDMPAFNFGPQVVEFCVQTPIDVHPMANEYRSLESETDRLEFLHRKTEDIRKLVQSAIDAISSGRRTMRIAE
jgi:hypothetical protein